MFFDFKPRLGLSKTETNILLGQIRAEKNVNRRYDPPICGYPIRDVSQTGKKIFKEKLYINTSLQGDSYQNRSRSKSFSRSPCGKVRNQESTTIEKSPKATSKKRVVLDEQHMNQSHYSTHMHRNAQSTRWNPIGFNPREKGRQEFKFSKRRNDMSPTNQNRLSPGFNLFRS